MSTKLVEPRRRGANPNRLTANQLIFVEKLLADPGFSPTRAARAAGYKNPTSMGNKLLKLPAIKAAIGKAIALRIAECKLDAKAVLEQLRLALFLDPIDLFKDGGDGTYVVKSLDEIPAEVRRCITKIKSKVRYNKKGDPDETYVEVELMSKDSALQLAMKHLGILGPDGNTVNVNVEGNVVMQLLEKAEEERRVIDVQFIEAQVNGGG